MRILIILLGIATATATAAWAQEASTPALASPGWVDGDGDGRHDLFCDLEGDGVNDVNHQRYTHRFAWTDADGDGLNDCYRDADGDGVNDLETAFRDRNGDGRDDNVLDLDGDGGNDITGAAYARDDLHGDRFGFVLDGAAWVDEDGDGFADVALGQGQAGRGDRFVDSDGDGLADGCWFQDGGFQHRRGRIGPGGGAGTGPRRTGGGAGRGGGGHWGTDIRGVAVTTRATLTSLAALVLITAAPVLAQSPVSAGGGAMHVWTDNVFGTEPSPGDGITDGRGWLTWTPATAVRLGASGRLLRFQDNEDLNHGYFSLTAEAVPNAPGSRTRWQTGLSSAWRLNADLYEPFDYRDLSGYLSARHYFAPEFSLQLRADASARSYPDASSEDARKLWLTTRLQRSLPTRTSLTLALRAGLKRYRDDVQPGAGVRDINLQVAQSVTPRVALRTWLADAQLFEHGDAAAQMAAFDNPLLDEFSFDGSRFGAAVKVIMPKNVTADLMVERAWLDYPGRPPALYDPLKNEFVLSDGLLALAPGERADDVTRVRLSLERPGVRVGNAARLDLNAAVEWNDQASNDLYWQWNGWSMQAGASVAF